MATATPTYAALRNAKYRNTSSHFVDLVQRLNDTINNLPRRAQANWTANLKKAIQSFKRSYPNVKNFSDRKLFRLCKAYDIPLMDIMVDTTMQREPDLQWILKIITNFRAYQAQPMQVFATADGKWGAWDSQHTALAMYLIAEHALGLDLTTVMVPANIYDVTSRADLRNLFINMNTTTGKNAGKKPLDIIDIFEQMIYGVEVDGVTEQDWVDAHTKWQHLAAAGMFVTAEKFNNTDETGAISRLNEIMDSSPEAVRQFSVYGKYVVESQGTAKNPRSINSKEIPIILEFLNLCEQNQIRYSDAVIEDLAQHCIDLFDANFDAKGPYWMQVHEANVNAYNKAHKGIPKHMWPEAPRNAKNTPQGTAFFWHQLMKSWVPSQAANFKFPKQPFSVYTPDVKDLY
jgi:hypothetical protein